MIIFINDDRSYLAWVRSHRDGFVLDAPRASGRSRRVLHRTTCPLVRTGKRHWTTCQRLKACSLDMAELIEWGRQSSYAQASVCDQCRPDTKASSDQALSKKSAVHLSPLAGNVLNYVLESTVVQLTNHDPEYRLTVSDIASCLRKTPSQLRPALERLAHAALLEFSPPARGDAGFTARAMVAPTIAALRTLPAYAESSEDELQAELAELGRQAG
jgi:hypothetical protein